jgi:hypothetical protein
VAIHLSNGLSSNLLFVELSSLSTFCNYLLSPVTVFEARAKASIVSPNRFLICSIVIGLFSVGAVFLLVDAIRTSLGRVRGIRGRVKERTREIVGDSKVTRVVSLWCGVWVGVMNLVGKFVLQSHGRSFLLLHIPYSSFVYLPIV